MKIIHWSYNLSPKNFPGNDIVHLCELILLVLLVTIFRVGSQLPGQTNLKHTGCLKSKISHVCSLISIKKDTESV